MQIVSNVIHNTILLIITGGAVDMGLPPTSVTGLIPVLAISYGLSLLLALALLRGFFSGFSGFPPSIKTKTSKFQFNLDVECLNISPWFTKQGDHSLCFSTLC